MLTNRLRAGACALLVAAIAAPGTALAADGSLMLNADLYDGSAEVKGWGTSVVWIGAGRGGSYRIGAAGVSMEDAHWAYVSGGRTFQFGARHHFDASMRLGKASLPGQSDDFNEVSATLYAGLAPGRVTLVLGDSWLDIGDTEGQLLQGGLDITAAQRWGAGLRLYTGMSGDLDDKFATGSVSLRGTSATWTFGVAVGRTVPYRGAPGSETQSSTEIYMTVALTVGRHRMNVAASSFQGESTRRRMLSTAWFIPFSGRPAKGGVVADDD
ncbi:MAG TPA: hypothetical protein VEW47_12150 [Candidatus Dormibacteraeota bacterium]|nr:hypothetical protein [Candidatus Dormibacteraeota bacterium]